MADVKVIQQRIADLEKQQYDARCLNEMIKSELENDQNYTDLLEEKKVIDQKIKLRKGELLEKHQEKIAELKNIKYEIKTNQMILSGELYGYYNETEKPEIEIDEDEMRKIVIKVRTVKTNQLNLFE